MRGTDFCKSKFCPFCGITPAHAGNRIKQRPHGHNQKDHPRACGEQFCLSINKDWQTGITPAHAGNSDEPTPLIKYTLGSPPRMRGTADIDFSNKTISRITPAHAGNSKFSMALLDDFGDHPRACGEQLMLPLFL